MTEDMARKQTACPVCGAPKAIGALMCWGTCWRGPRGLKHSGLSFAEWLEDNAADALRLDGAA